MVFKERLKEKRAEANLTQVELAEKAGVTARTIQNYELGNRKPSNMTTVQKIADALNTMDEDHFLHLTDVGREVAEKIYERHCFFTEQLIAAGVDPKTAEADACRIEHIISDESFSRLKEAATQDQE